MLVVAVVMDGVVLKVVDLVAVVLVILVNLALLTEVVEEEENGDIPLDLKALVVLESL